MKIKNSNNIKLGSLTIDVTDEQMKRLSKRLLPEIKKFFADEKVKQEFEEWKQNQQNKEK
jgi:hypothetical protein